MVRQNEDGEVLIESKVTNQEVSRKNNEKEGGEPRESEVGNQEEGRVQIGRRGKELLTYSKNKERRIFGVEDMVDSVP